MKVYKSRWFQRFAQKERIGDLGLIEAVLRAERGNIDANLGGEVIKQRIARAGRGKSKGYRIIIFFRRGMRAFLIYRFAKSDKADINHEELEVFRQSAKHVLSLTDKQLEELLDKGDFVEVMTT